MQSFVALGCAVCLVVVGVAHPATTSPQLEVHGGVGGYASTAATSTVHVPPVDAPIVDPFRMPAQPWLAGNRGLEYNTQPGQTVRASADGVVTFAGNVAGSLFVTIRHDSDLRTTVGFVDSIDVSAGDVVRQGMPIATAGQSMHFSARRGESYIDPASLFQSYRVVVRLVAGPHGS